MTFLHPLYLLGISLIAVPIIIHLWFKKRLKKIPFSTLRFLKKSEAKKFGWLKFREILILVLRCLFITFLFLSLAKPQIKGKFFGAGRLSSVILVIDNSYSMAYGENFKLVKEAANELLSFYSPKSEFCVLPLCKTEFYNNDNEPHWVSKKSVFELINKLNLSYKSGSIKNVLSNLPTSTTNYRVEYVYIGDGQEFNFKDFPEELVKQANFYWLKIPSGGNISINKVTLKDPVSIPLDNYNLNVHITNFSQNSWNGKATLKTKDYYFEKDCEIHPEQELNLEFLLPVSAAHGKIVLYDDSLIADNVYYFSKLLPHRLNVIIVGNDRFLYSGLSSADESNSPFYVESVEYLQKVNFPKFDVVILNGIDEISESDKIKLDNFINQNQKSVIFFMGKKVGNNLKNFISQSCNIENPISPKGYATLDWVDYAHPIFNVFVGSTVLKNIKFYHFQKIIAHKGIIAKLTGDYPFLVIDDNLAIVATQFTPHNTDIVYKTAFIPLVFRLIINTTYKSYNKEFYVGENITTYTKLKAPTGEYLTKGTELLVPGFYTVDSETIGVNVIPEEGNLKILGDGAAKILNIQTITLDNDLAESNLSHTLLYFVLFIILLELLLLLLY